MADILSSYFSPSGQYDLGTPANRPGNIYAAPQAVTQATSVSTAVTCNGTQGVITTFTQSAAGLAKSTFTVNNSSVRAGDSVQATISNYAGTYFTNGTPTVSVNNVVDGAFDINVINLHTANALSGVAKISFKVN